mmetsp:Transcript_30387/g.78598  ORF Transcript_30387/g.78598 Transcript_30387/m.78598 type:complete len:80 (+) Transcript_30387:1258-1497(+)
MEVLVVIYESNGREFLSMFGPPVSNVQLFCLFAITCVDAVCFVYVPHCFCVHVFLRISIEMHCAICMFECAYRGVLGFA